MSFFASTLVLLIISCIFVIYLWAKLFIHNYKHRPKETIHYRSMLTSSGLFIGAVALVVASFARFADLRGFIEVDVAGTTIGVCLLFICFGNFLLILAATNASRTRQLKFLIATFVAWVVVTGFFVKF